ncbi:beta-lactamase regulatory protein BlaR [Gottschalkia acidurici 9a]|uniref:Beta-lactamase regulatory protein BlaR n=1 Tax=Gottschalkia acidurici (strain ATCC 7906 / DSM 604 / BCRC 14475 / CIP 104303 / KCTC 5404 / NCIMB 10678 / 9a) TaxID=1128398 RepID=K0AWM2_GOTA9|nr:M56 family metallopeptidase [Gottschalkia acidurici]AFS77130.1 beta-lactamase regulatory protein BlaR [Gottschalkia acidurici 9a]
MNILKEIFLWVIYSSITASLISTIIILIKKICNNHIKPRVQHALWFLVLIKLLIPFSLQSDISIFNLFPQNIISTTYEEANLSRIYIREERLNDKWISGISEDRDNLKMKTNDKKKKTSKEKISLKDKAIEISVCLWTTGTIFLGALVLVSSISFKKNKVNFSKVKDLKTINILNLTKEKLKLKKDISIYTSNKIKTPFIYGILKPKVYIPKQILSLCNESELNYIILHELIHYKRKDLIWNLLSILAIIVHWFNPIVWISMKKMRQDREVACDNLVLETIGEEESIDYGMTIITLSKIKLNNSDKRLINLYFYEDKNQIERRINLIKRFRKDSYKISVGGALVITLLSAVTLTNASGYNISSDTYVNMNIEQKELHKYKELDVPYKSFNNLERAADFISFDLRVPDYIPEGYELYQIHVEKDNQIKIDFGRDIRDTNNNEEHFDYIVSTESIVENIKKTFKDNERVTIEEKPMTISNIKGINLIKTRKFENDPNQELRDIYEVQKYFIWETNGLWYGIKYYRYDNISDRSEYLSEISKVDMEKIIASLKHFKDISNVSYISKSWEPYFNIYGEKDFRKAEKQLGFTPKFKLNLPEGLTMKLSQVGEVLYASDEKNNEYQKLRDLKSYYDIKNNSEVQISFRQIKSYTDDYIEKLEKSKGNGLEKINIDEVEVLKYEVEQEHYSNRITQETEQNVKLKIYKWEQNGVIYTLSINTELDNENEILKAFIK